MKGYKNVLCEWQWTNSWVVLLTKDKMGFISKTVKRDKEGHWILAKINLLRKFNKYKHMPDIGVPKILTKVKGK